jgi:hypothetical protein
MPSKATWLILIGWCSCTHTFPEDSNRVTGLIPNCDLDGAPAVVTRLPSHATKHDCRHGTARTDSIAIGAVVTAGVVLMRFVVPPRIPKQPRLATRNFPAITAKDQINRRFRRRSATRAEALKSPAEIQPAQRARTGC